MTSSSNPKSISGIETASSLKIAVAYIARGADNGLEKAEAFFQSYEKNNSGIDHKLYVLMKGWDGMSLERQRLIDKCKVIKAELIHLQDDGFDWGAYFRFSKITNAAYICCLNSHSLIAKPNWLNQMIKGIESSNNIGLIGCTASYGTLAPNLKLYWPQIEYYLKNKNFTAAVGKLARLIASIAFYWLPNILVFPSFPNSHIRSNAFVIRRDDFIDFAENSLWPRSKSDAHRLESGHKSLTNFIKSKGLRVVVATDLDCCIHEDQWINKVPFRNPNAQGLLVSDNQTRCYENAEHDTKKRLELSAWGVCLSP